MTLLEICLDDLEGAVVADREGADRIELCAALSEGGITPSIGTVAEVLRTVRSVGVQVIIRQRPGDFVYSESEVRAMVADIEAIRGVPADVTVGFVVGALNPDSTVDTRATARLVAAAGGAPVTFHKAFDDCPDLPAALEELVAAGVDRVLTSGGAPSALAGADALAGLVAQARGRIAILAGGGVRPANVRELLRASGVREVHLRAAAPVPDARPGASPYSNAGRSTTSAEAVREMRRLCGRDVRVP